MQFTSPFSIGAKVYVDGDTSITASVIGLMWTHAHGAQVQCGWLHNGSSVETWIAEWRVKECEA